MGGSDATSGDGRCCWRACTTTEMNSDYAVTTEWGGWDIYTATSSTGAGAEGDPHFITWSGGRFDFHGICDLVLVSTRNFYNTLGMDVHIRTERTRNWSFI